MPRFKDQAICIRQLDWSESSQVVVLLTQQHGKINGLAKGSKRHSPSAIARFSGGIDLLTQGQIVATTRPHAELATLTEWNLQQPFRHLHVSLSNNRLGYFAADLCHAMLADADPHPKSYEALEQFLTQIQDSATHSMIALLVFQWTLLCDCGYQPQLEKDFQGGQPLAEKSSYEFDPQAGGFTAQIESKFATTTNGPWKVRRQTLDLLRHIATTLTHNRQSIDLTAISSPDDPQTLERANRLLCVYIRTLLGQNLPTMRFILR